MIRAASRALAAASLTALLAPLLPPLWPLNALGMGVPWRAPALAAPLILGALPALLSALWIVEVAPRPLARLLRTVYDTAASVPSFAWVALLGPSVAPHAGPTVTASLVLAVVAAPTTALAALDALDRTPVELREAALALGASPWQVARSAVLPATWRALVSAVLVGVGRALGESLVLVALAPRPAVGYAWLLAVSAFALAVSRYDGWESDP